MPPVLATAAAPRAIGKPPTDLRLLRGVVFLYLALWIFEGALRKWVFPGMANLLLVVRDPVLLAMYALALMKGVFPRSAFIFWIVGLGALAAFVSLAATNTPLVVTAYGLRADFLHLPLIFLLPNVLRRSDLRLIGKCWLVTAVGMAGLVVVQFGSNGGAYVNRGAGEGTVMLDSAFGHIRPSGTFSYSNGLGGFTAITMAFFLQHLLEKRVYPRLVWLAAIPAVMLLIILSGSRAAAAGIGLILLGMFCICLLQSRYRAASIKLVALLGACVLLAGSFTVFQKGMDVFSDRFASHKGEANGFVGRYFSTFATPFIMIDQANAGGAGLGMGTNVAAGLAGGQRKITLSEGEGGRVVLESGPVVGLAYLALRLAITVYLGTIAVKALREHAATLPLLLFSGFFNDTLIGQFSQATELGFATIAAGLCLTGSLRAGERPDEDEDEDEGEEATAEKRTAPPVTVSRGRSAYAAQLHGHGNGERHTHDEN